MKKHSKVFKALTLLMCLVVCVVGVKTDVFAANTILTTEYGCGKSLCFKDVLISGPYGNPDEVINTSVPYVGGMKYKDAYQLPYVGSTDGYKGEHMYVIYCPKYDNSDSSLLRHTMVLMYADHGYTTKSYTQYNASQHYANKVCDHAPNIKDDSTIRGFAQGLSGENAYMSEDDLYAIAETYQSNTGCGVETSVLENHTWSYGAWYNKGVTVVVAAGNENQDVSNVVPASVNNVITVASIDESLAPSSFSNYGSFVDIAAPGRNINSSIPYNNNIDPIEHTYDNHYYGSLNGTSMATPFVSAASAMLKTINTSYTPYNIENVLKDSSYKPDSWNESYGTGIVNFVNMSSYTKTAAPTITLGKDGATITAPHQAKVYYTTDGTNPVVGESNLYLGQPIKTTGVEKIKAIAFIEGQLQSDVTTRSLKWTKNTTICERKISYSKNQFATDLATMSLDRKLSIGCIPSVITTVAGYRVRDLVSESGVKNECGRAKLQLE